MSVTTSPLAPAGVELECDLRDTETHAEVAKLFKEHGLLVLRNQKLSQDEQKTVLSKIGLVLDHWVTVGYVSNTRKDGILGDSEVSFHSDMIYTPKPILVISLHALEVPPGKSWTRYASLANALRRLPAGTRERLEGVEGLNLFSATPESLRGRQLLSDYPETAPRAQHPVLHIDPMTGQDVLYATEQNTAQLVGLDERESEELLAELRSYVLASDNIYEHRWYDGDLVIWSNQAFLHARGGVTPGETRTLQRVCCSDAQPEMYQPPASNDRLPEAMRM